MVLSVVPCTGCWVQEKPKPHGQAGFCVQMSQCLLHCGVFLLFARLIKNCGSRA